MPRFFVKRQKPFSDAQWTGYLTLIVRDKYTGRRWSISRARKHDPIFRTSDDGIPCARRIGILVERAPTSLRSDNEPSVIRSLVTKQRKVVLAKALRRPVDSTVLSNTEAHLLHKTPIK